jgi:hypothetical protein
LSVIAVATAVPPLSVPTTITWSFTANEAAVVAVWLPLCSVIPAVFGVMA